MAIFFTRGRKAPYQQHVGFSLSTYLTEATRAELQLRVEEALEEISESEPSGRSGNLHELLNQETVSMWGAKDKHSGLFSQMETGDAALFIDTSMDQVDHCMQVDMTPGAETGEQLRRDISEHIWRDDSFEYMWFSSTPVERLYCPVDELESLIQGSNSAFDFPTSWFSMGDDFHKLDIDTLAALGGQEAVLDELRGANTETLASETGHYLIIDRDCIREQDYWAVAAKFTDQNGLDATSTGYDDYKDGADARIRYIEVDRSSGGSELLHTAANDGVVLVRDGENIVGEGRHAHVPE